MISHTILENEIHLINLSQPLHAKVAQETIQFFREISQQGAKKVIVNLENVPFIDSHGLAALVVGLKIFDDDKNLRLAAPQAQPRLLFELTMFDRIFRIADSVTAARATL
ncbi:MAG: STAS domain-containing protein [Chloroflexi bacterium]|nr:STAS domain-containing protein [Chloroflexota bacterium]